MKEFAAWVLGTGLLATGLGLLWPWIEHFRLDRFGLGHLPGDVSLGHEGMRFHLPLTSALVIAVLVSAPLLVWRFTHS